VDLRAGLDDVEKRKFLTLPGLERDHSVAQPVASSYTGYAVPAPFLYRYLHNLNFYQLREY
jgi:hypothetical protein